MIGLQSTAKRIATTLAFIPISTVAIKDFFEQLSKLFSNAQISKNSGKMAIFTISAPKNGYFEN